MSKYTQTISFEQAKKMAKKMALTNVKSLLQKNQSPLAEDYIETDFCWLFFRNRDISIPSEAILQDFSYVISKKGDGRYVGDYSNSSKKPRNMLILFLTISKKTIVKSILRI